MSDFVDFLGDENEQEFLEKCLKQWEITAGQEISDVQKIIRLATVFVEIKNRIEELSYS